MQVEMKSYGTYVFKLAGAEFFVANGVVVAVRTKDTAVKADTANAVDNATLGIKNFRIVNKGDLQDVIKRACVVMGKALIELGQLPTSKEHH